jgi:hypothetical protein
MIAGWLGIVNHEMNPQSIALPGHLWDEIVQIETPDAKWVKASKFDKKCGAGTLVSLRK